MNKIEQIARQLSSFEGLPFDDLKPKATNMTDGNTQSTYLGRAKQIAQLYEPPPDSSRLLTDEEATTQVMDLLEERKITFPTPEQFDGLHREVQDAQTARTYEAKVEALIEEIVSRGSSSYQASYNKACDILLELKATHTKPSGRKGDEG